MCPLTPCNLGILKFSLLIFSRCKKLLTGKTGKEKREKRKWKMEKNKEKMEERKVKMGIVKT